tara:strand:+ start:3464 stop:3655 length:192 start_codon:yes stop_codon:yes gene_type:complete
MKIEERLLRLPEVINMFGIKKTCIYDRMKKGSFPKNVSLGGNIVAWRATDLNTHMNKILSGEV